MFKKIILTAGIGVFLFQSIPAFADFHRDDRGEGFHRWEYGHVIHRLPPGYMRVMVNGMTYLYCEGLYYGYPPAGYVIVEPPVGAVIPALPMGYTRVIVQGRPYLYYGDSYYAPAPGGYQVVMPPAPSMAPAPVQVVRPEMKNEIDSYEIHIPNANGSYTLVILKKTDKGFQGPQGEIYPEHPTVEQLKAMYAKK